MEFQLEIKAGLLSLANGQNLKWIVFSLEQIFLQYYFEICCLIYR